MEDNKKKIEDFLELLKSQSANDLKWVVEGDVGDILEHFAVLCKKCGSHKIFVSWEKGRNYGEYTGYGEKEKLFKCLNCGNAASFWE